MDKIKIPKNAKLIQQSIIIHQPQGMIEPKPSVIYEESWFYTEYMFLSYTYNGKANCIKESLYSELYARQKQFKSMFDYNERLDPHDITIIMNLIVDNISKYYNISSNELTIVPLYSAINFNR
jgi:hypothetical protein